MYKQELIKRILSCSPMVSISLTDTMGEYDVGNIPESHEDVVYEFCVELLEKDVRSLGLAIDYDGFHPFSKSNVDLLCTLREVWDTFNLLSRRINPKVDEIIDGVFENLLESSNLYVDLVEGLVEVFPMSEKWVMLRNEAHRVTHDQLFSAHVLAIRANDLGTTEQDEVLALALIDRLQEHLRRLDIVYSRLSQEYPELGLTMDEDRDSDLGRINPREYGIALFSQDKYFLPMDVSSSEALLRHVTRNAHHIEYWMHKKGYMEERDAVRLATEYFAYDDEVSRVSALLKEVFDDNLRKTFEDAVHKFKGMIHE